MAKMIPAFGPQETSSHGEKTVYSLLKEGLSDDFTVIHSLPWLSAAVNECGIKLPPSGEIDFLVLHPELGVLALEVKSGIYRVDGPVFVHIKSNRHADVVRQTRDNTHGLARWLGGVKKTYLRIGYGFIFPDSFFSEGVINPAMVDTTTEPFSRVFIDKNGLPSITEWVNDVMRYWKSALNNSTLGSQRVNEIISLICPHFDGTPDWGTRIVYDNKIWLRLTQEQSNVIDMLSEHQRFIVSGWPGTGKTIIGIEFARRLIAEKKKVLFITFNSRLADYIDQQIGDKLCEVSTWHRLCHQARNTLNSATDAPVGWFDKGCNEDLLEAFKKNKLKYYDALVIDEAQALQSAWIETLITWFKSKKILAFCDESQIFSFEKGIKHAELIQLLDKKNIFNLTIALRNPKAITDYLLSVKPTSYQLTSPRNDENDTLKELVVDDPISALVSEIIRLKKSNVESNKITILVPTESTKMNLENDLKSMGINIETVSRFRGMESPVVIALYASEMEEAQLFCAYSRATTAFIAIYDVEKLSWCKHHGFLLQLINRESIKEIISLAKKNSSAKTLMNNFFEKGNFHLNTVDLSWSDDFEGWLLQFEEENSPAETWIDYLHTDYSWPVFYWFSNSHRVIYHIEAKKSAPETLSKGESLYIKKCALCDKNTPHIFKGVCLLCKTKIRKLINSPTKEEIQLIRKFDTVISCNDFKNPENVEQRHLLPIPLAAVGAKRYAHTKGIRFEPLRDPLPSGRIIYRSALAFVQSRIAIMPIGKTLILDELTDSLRERFLHMNSLNRLTIKQALACALSTCHTKKLIKKNEKGKYSIIDKV